MTQIEVDADTLKLTAREWAVMKIALENIASDPCRECGAAIVAQTVLRRVNGEEPL